MIDVVDGKGNRFKCRILDPNPKGTSLEIVEKIPDGKKWKGNITLAVAPTKNNDRMSWLVEKAVEIGVDRIVFIDCKHNERHKISAERMRKVAVAAMKQSLKATLPVIDDLVPLDSFIKEGTEEGENVQKFFGYCDDSTRRKDFCREFRSGENAIILIGPEGDFSKEEVKKLVDNDFIPVTFGEMRLRTETAALFGLQAFHILNSLHN